MSAKKPKTETAESAAEKAETTAGTETKQVPGSRKIKFIKLVCKPIGTFLPGRVYELEDDLAEKFVKAGTAKEA